MYHPVLLEQVANPYHMAAMDCADGVGQIGFPGEGPFLIFYVRLSEEGLIENASFETYGCPSAIGCGSWLCRWVEGKKTKEILSITPDELMVAVGGLPLGKERAAQLAIGALRYAIEDSFEAAG